MDKLKDMASKFTGGSSGGSSTGSTGSKTGGKEDKYISQGVDTVTDKLGMGDKYDSKISDQANKQFDKQFGSK